jgi:hypothetical protein
MKQAAFAAVFLRNVGLFSLDYTDVPEFRSLKKFIVCLALTRAAASVTRQSLVLKVALGIEFKRCLSF